MDLYKKAVDRDEHPEVPSGKDSPNSANLREQRGKDFLFLGPRGTSTLANGGVLRLTEKEFAARNLCPSTSKINGCPASPLLFQRKPMITVWKWGYSPIYAAQYSSG